MGKATAINGANRTEDVAEDAGDVTQLAAAVAEDLEAVLTKRARTAREDAESAITGLRRTFVRMGGAVEELDAAIDEVLSSESRLVPFLTSDGGRGRRAWRALERVAQPRLGGVGALALRVAVAELSVELRRSEGLLEDLGQHVLDLVSDHDHQLRGEVDQDLPPAVRRVLEGRAACRAWAAAV